jgi:hypothetical protein
MRAGVGLGSPVEEARLVPGLRRPDEIEASEPTCDRLGVPVRAVLYEDPSLRRDTREVRTASAGLPEIHDEEPIVLDVLGNVEG